MKFESVFVSDIHLGTRGANVDLFLDFIKHMECKNLYIVGDFIDGWAMKRGKYWPREHNTVIQKILRFARKKDTKVIYVPGNHDEFFRSFCGLNFGDIKIVEDYIHISKNGKKYLVIHGDMFDSIVMHRKWLAVLGSHAYEIAIFVNRIFSKIRKIFTKRHWSLSAFLKKKVKNVVKYIDTYEKTVSTYVEKKGLDGVICGHIHSAEIKEIDDISYMNCGDWVESCTALVEDENGNFSLVEWKEKLP